MDKTNSQQLTPPPMERIGAKKALDYAVMCESHASNLAHYPARSAHADIFLEMAAIFRAMLQLSSNP